VPQPVQQPQLCAKIDATAPNQSNSHAEPSDFSTIPLDRQEKKGSGARPPGEGLQF
jgi:hypothetical protein